MSSSRTSTSVYEVPLEDFRTIQLEPKGFPTPSQLASERQRRASIAQSQIHESTESLHTVAPPQKSLSKWRTGVIIGTVATINFLNSMLSGLLVVGLPTMARELGLAEELLLWPASVNALACGCTLLVAGSIADVVGGRKIYLIGTVALIATTVACGLARDGLQLILFRAAQGLSVSLCIPSSVIVITSNIPTGSGRNIAFACLGAGNPVGFSVGLVLGGVFVEGIGWRWGYYIGAIVAAFTLVVCIFGVPSDKLKNQAWNTTLTRLRTEIDWIGCLLISTSLGLFSYILSVLASGLSRFLAPTTIALFSVATLLVPVFCFYSLRQEKLGKKVIIPPSLWKNRVFTSLCLSVFLTWGTFNGVQFFTTLFFQEIQHLSAIQTSIRFLPMVFTGAATNFATGWLVKRVRADLLVWASAAITSISPLLMAVIKPEWTYWVCAFIAVACTPLCADTLFTVANLLITSVFRPETHGLAGGVFNTVSNIGNSVGLAITAVIASSITMARNSKEPAVGDHLEHNLMDGYRAAFWFCFAGDVLILLIVALGLRKIGKVGIKIE